MLNGEVEMYISLADSRAKGFVKWADAHQRERLGDAPARAPENGVIAALDLDRGATKGASRREQGGGLRLRSGRVGVAK